MKRCFMWDTAQPFVIAHLDCRSFHQAGLVKYSVQQNAAACPVVNLPKFSFVTSPCSPPPFTLFLPTGCRWLFTSYSKFWSWCSRLLGESCVHICRLRSIRTHQLVLCALLQPATQLSAPCGSFVIISPGLDFFFYFFFLLFPNSKMSFLLQAGKRNCSISCVVKYSVEYLVSSLTLKTSLVPVRLNFLSSSYFQQICI